MFPCQDYKNLNNPTKNAYAYGQKLEKNVKTEMDNF